MTAIRFCALLELHPVAAIRVEFSRNQSRGGNEEFLSVLLTFGVSHGKITMNKVVNSAKMRINMQQQSSVVHETYHMQDQDTISPGFAIFFRFKIALAMRKLQGRRPFGGMCKGYGSNTD